MHMLSNWPDVLKGLRLLEEYKTRLEGTDELALQGVLKNAIAAIRSSLFTAVLGKDSVNIFKLPPQGVIFSEGQK